MKNHPKKEQLQALGEYVLFRLLSPAEMQTKGGIVLPNKKSESQRAKVLSVGPVVTRCKEGDEVFFMGNAGVMVVNGEEVCVVPENAVMAVIK